MRVCDCISHLMWINIRFHDDVLGTSCTDEAYDFAEDFAYLATSCFAFAVIFFVAYWGCKGLIKYKKMAQSLKVLFYMACASSLCLTALCISTVSLCLASFQKEAIICGAVSIFVYAFVFLCIWSNLILRLFVAFQNSAYKITRRERIGYGVVFVFLVLNAIATSICQFLLLVGQGLAPSIYVQFFLGIVFMVVFAVSAICAVCSFMGKLFVLGKARTLRQFNAFDEEQPIDLNQKQEKLIALSTKYVSLFFVASLSSFITLFSGFYESASGLRVSLFLVPTDCAVNLLCIYLHYAFAEDKYQRYCSKLGWSCKKIMTGRWVQAIHSKRREERDAEVKRMQRALEVMEKNVVSTTLASASIPRMRTIPEKLALEVKISGKEQGSEVRDDAVQ